MELTGEHFRAMIYYDFKDGSSQQNCFERLTRFFGNQVPSRTTVYDWYGNFKRGRQGCRGNGISIPIPFPQDFCGNTHKNPQNPQETSQKTHRNPQENGIAQFPGRDGIPSRELGIFTRPVPEIRHLNPSRKLGTFSVPSRKLGMPQENPQNPHVGIPIGLKSFPFPSHMGIPMGKPTDSHSHGNPGGRPSLEDDSRSGRPSTATCPENVDKVQMVEENPRITIEDIEGYLGIGSAAVQSIIHDYLGLRKLAAR